MTDLSAKPALIAAITSHAELDAYEAEARRRRLTPDEMRAIDSKRKSLGVRK